MAIIANSPSSPVTIANTAFHHKVFRRNLSITANGRNIIHADVRSRVRLTSISQSPTPDSNFSGTNGVSVVKLVMRQTCWHT
jgi:hypothetical protein